MPGMAPARHDQDLVQSGIDQGMQGVVDHGFVVHRQQVLVGDLGQRVEAGTGAACEDYAFHVILTFRSFAPVGQGQIVSLIVIFL